LPIHLSNSPEPRRSPPRIAQRAVEAPNRRLAIGGWSPNISEELRRRVIAPRRRRTVWPLYRPAAQAVSTPGWRILTGFPQCPHMRARVEKSRGPDQSKAGCRTWNLKGTSLTQDPPLPHSSHIPGTELRVWVHVGVRAPVAAFRAAGNGGGAASCMPRLMGGPARAALRR